MKSFKHEYKGYGRLPSTCMVHVDESEGFHHILFEETEFDEGTSVTNASEQLATEIVNLLNLDPAKCRFYETYHYDSRVDGVKYDWKDGKAKNASWAPQEKIFKNIK